MSIYNSFESELTTIMGLGEDYDGIGLQEEDELDGLASAEAYGMIVRDQMAIESAFFVMENYGFENFTTSTEGIGNVFKTVVEFVKKIFNKIIELITRFFKWIGGIIGGLFGKTNAKATVVTAMVAQLKSGDAPKVEKVVQEIIEKRKSTAHADNLQHNKTRIDARNAKLAKKAEDEAKRIANSANVVEHAKEINKAQESANASLAYREKISNNIGSVANSIMTSKVDPVGDGTEATISKLKTEITGAIADNEVSGDLENAIVLAEACSIVRKDPELVNVKTTKQCERFIRQGSNSGFSNELRTVQSITTNLVKQSGKNQNTKVKSIYNTLEKVSESIAKFVDSNEGTSDGGISAERLKSLNGVRDIIVKLTKEVSEISNLTITLNNESIKITKDQGDILSIVESSLKKAVSEGIIDIKVDASGTGAKDFGRGGNGKFVGDTKEV